MVESLRLMCILAHPDDESMGLGGTLAKCGREGVETYLVTATRGEYGWPSQQGPYPGPEQLGQRREAELRAAADVLKLCQVDLLNYIDGKLDIADSLEAIARIAAFIRRVRPQVVITFGPEGVYGHPDHITVSQWTSAAILAAAAQDDDPGDRELPSLAPHRVSKLYYMAVSEQHLSAYQAVFGELAMHVDGEVRRAFGWTDWAITTRIDTEAYGQIVWQAIACHQSQLSNNVGIASRAASASGQLWASQSFYRVFSLVNGGPTLETDLFAGLR